MPFDHELDEAVAGVGDQRDRVQEVVDDHRLEDVELEVALRAGEADGCRRAVNLRATMVIASHCVGFTLPGMIEEPGSFSGIDQFAQAAARAGSEPANVVGNFHQRSGERFQRALREHEFVVRGERRELVGMRAEGKPGQFGDFLRGAFGEFRMRVQARCPTAVPPMARS